MLMVSTAKKWKKIQSKPRVRLCQSMLDNNLSFNFFAVGTVDVKKKNIVYSGSVRNFNWWVPKFCSWSSPPPIAIFRTRIYIYTLQLNGYISKFLYMLHEFGMTKISSSSVIHSRKFICNLNPRHFTRFLTKHFTKTTVTMVLRICQVE